MLNCILLFCFCKIVAEFGIYVYNVSVLFSNKVFHMK